MDLTVERLRELLSYNPETGVLTWKARELRPGFERIDKGWNTRFAGKKAGRLGKYGHLYVGIAYRRLYESRNFAAHRVAWALHYGEWPERGIDHANGNGLDNRICNLRLATQVENLRNSRIRSDNTSGHKGVSWSKKERKWYAYINVNGRLIALGRFRNLEEAVQVRRAAAHQHFGEFSNEA